MLVVRVLLDFSLFLFFFPFPLSFPNLSFPQRLPSEASFSLWLLIGSSNHFAVAFSSLTPMSREGGRA